MTDTPFSLSDRIAALRQEAATPSPDDIVLLFLAYAESLDLALYPAQEEAILELAQWKHVVLNTPTGSGKSMVALFLQVQALCEGRTAWYTAPTKALVNEKFFWLCDVLGAEHVGLLTGDGSVNRDAPIICCTAEVLSNLSLRSEDPAVDYVIMDEFHFYGDRERGIAWQIPLITMRDAVFLLMSATLGNTDSLVADLAGFTDRDVSVVKGAQRPVPLTFEYREAHLHEIVEGLVQQGGAPLYVVNFTQREASEQARNLMSINVTSREEKQAIAQELEGVRFDTPYGREIQRLVRHGIGVHHAGLLPKYRRIVERLAQQGLIKVVSGTDTLGVGVNIPIRTVVFSRLYKYDGVKQAIVTAREFHQIAGRAGRKGFDDEGLVVVQAPEWVVENRRMEKKLAVNPHLKKKLVRKKPPTGAIAWDQQTMERLIAAEPEALTPQFEVTCGMLVLLLQSAPQRRGGGYRRLVELIGRSHGTDPARSARLRHAAVLMRSLRHAGIISAVDTPEGRQFRVSEDLQDDFSLHHALSLYLAETIALVEDGEQRHLNMLSLVEAVVENPNAILYRQIDRLKGELVGRLKAEGVAYEERMEELEKVTYPKPCEAFVQETFSAFSSLHPWVARERAQPKSIAREMFEGVDDFNAYILRYGLARSEGTLLRYLSQVYKTALQNVPEHLWDAGFEDALAYLHGLVRRVDATLLEEWSRLMQQPLPVEAAPDEGPPAKERLIDNPRALRARLRSDMHVLLAALAHKQWEEASALLVSDGENAWTAEMLEAAMALYFAAYDAVDVTPRARMAHNTLFREQDRGEWLVVQRIEDPEGETDASLECRVDVHRDADVAGPILSLVQIHT
ncbi:MAG: DUF3516 domain-containing protein [Myxococcales bacterium]|nr:DUF3516 domain-containing protein [Myxococcales bacterium]